MAYRVLRIEYCVSSIAYRVSACLGRWISAGGLLCIVLVMVLGLSGCGKPDVQPLVFDETPWQGGEVSVYRVSDLNGAYAGTARFDITATGSEDGLGGWIVRRELATQGDKEVTVVEIGAQGARPKAATLIRIGESGQESIETEYEPGRAILRLTTMQDVTTFEAIDIPSDARDERTVLMMARSLPLMDGYATRFNSFLPVTGQLNRVLLQVVEREQVTTPVGVFETWRTEFASERIEKTEAWIGVEAPYPLVKFVDGRSGGTFELIEYRAGK